MLKHARGQRRRSKRTSTLAISGLTTAILAGGGLLAAVPASAATGWDAVAQCESGGNAKYNDGQFYGLYNFDQGTWNATGRSGTADQSSAAEQLAAAQELYAQRGAAPWPVCGKYLSGGSTASTASRSVSRAPVASAPVASAPTKATTSTRKAPAPKASSSTSAGVRNGGAAARWRPARSTRGHWDRRPRCTDDAAPSAAAGSLLAGHGPGWRHDYA